MLTGAVINPCNNYIGLESDINLEHPNALLTDFVTTPYRGLICIDKHYLFLPNCL